MHKLMRTWLRSAAVTALTSRSLCAVPMCLCPSRPQREEEGPDARTGSRPPPMTCRPKPLRYPKEGGGKRASRRTLPHAPHAPTATRRPARPAQRRGSHWQQQRRGDPRPCTEREGAVSGWRRADRGRRAARRRPTRRRSPPPRRLALPMPQRTARARPHRHARGRTRQRTRRGGGGQVARQTSTSCSSLASTEAALKCDRGSSTSLGLRVCAAAATCSVHSRCEVWSCSASARAAALLRGSEGCQGGGDDQGRRRGRR